MLARPASAAVAVMRSCLTSANPLFISVMPFIRTHPTRKTCLLTGRTRRPLRLILTSSARSQRLLAHASSPCFREDIGLRNRESQPCDTIFAHQFPPQNLRGAQNTYIYGDDVRHGRKRRQPGADFGVEAGVLYLVGLDDRPRSCPSVSTSEAWRVGGCGWFWPTCPDPSSRNTLPNVDVLTDVSNPLRRSMTAPNTLAPKLLP